MAEILDFSTQIIDSLLKSSNKLCVFCCSKGDISSISVNVALAKKILECKELRCPNSFTYAVERFICELPDRSVISDIDVLFNPAYKIDVICLLATYAKKKPFSIIWPGTYKNNKLYYAELGYPDYKEFDLNNYDITVIV